MNVYGVFLYEIGEVPDTDDEIVLEECAYFNVEYNATWYAEEKIHEFSKHDYYMEVWKRDEEGLYGNSGEPIWASKSSGFYKER